MLFTVEERSLEIALTHLTIAGWTGRDRAGVDHHIEELAALGVAPPSSVPLFYRASPALLTQSEHIDVVGTSSSGEAEPLLLKTADGLWLGLGSDHTDRDLETHSVALSKQLCAKPVSTALWQYADVQDHLDDLQLHAWIEEDNEWTLYQEGTLANIRPLQELLTSAELPNHAAMLAGTLPAIGGVRTAPRFRMTLTDPVRDRSLSHQYQINSLPVID